ncbi:MAG: hypothetical protein R6V06_10375 [Kiritimatiellia bacterium]
MSQNIIQLISTLLFVISAFIYYSIRRKLHKHGYPVSIFVYSGPCWKHYDDLIAESEPRKRQRLKLYKYLMAACLILAITLLLVAGFFQGDQ